MIFYFRGRNVNIPNLHINSITIDKHLTLKGHVHLIANKISRTVGVIKRLKHYIPQNVLLTIYINKIIPNVNNAILTWGFIPERILKIRKKCQVNHFKQIEIFTFSNT